MSPTMILEIALGIILARILMFVLPVVIVALLYLVPIVAVLALVALAIGDAQQQGVPAKVSTNSVPAKVSAKVMPSAPKIIYRYVESDGTLTFSDDPPVVR